MTWFYLRWVGVLVVAVVLTALTYQHYEENLKTVTPETVLTYSPSNTDLRVKGMVKSGTLTGDLEAGEVRFELVGTEKSASVQYAGPTLENLRELKTVVVVGQWDPALLVLRGKEIALVPNYGFVMWAYLVAFVPLALFLFSMSRRVDVLFQEIKESKLYEPEEGSHAE